MVVEYHTRFETKKVKLWATQTTNLVVITMFP